MIFMISSKIGGSWGYRTPHFRKRATEKGNVDSRRSLIDRKIILQCDVWGNLFLHIKKKKLFIPKGLSYENRTCDPFPVSSIVLFI